MRTSTKKVIASITAGMMAMVLALGAVPSTSQAGVLCSKDGKKAGKADFDPAAEYHAYFGFQQSEAWVFRNNWDEPTLGQSGTSFGGKDVAEDAGFDKFLKSGENGVEVVPGDLTDVTIDGNGTYKVSVTGVDPSVFDPSAENICMVYVSTDIPTSALDNGLTVSDFKLSVDGIEKWSGEPYVSADQKEWGLLEYDIVNTYQQDGYEGPGMTIPQNSVEITFTVSGMTNDSTTANGADTTSAATSGDTSSATSTSGDATSEAAASTGVNTTTVIIIVAIIAVVAVAGVVIVVSSKKKKN